MNTPSFRPPPRGLTAALCLFAAACTDLPTTPSPAEVPAVAVPVMTCVAHVRAEQLSCTSANPQQTQLAIAANRILGGQDVYLKLANSGTTYDEAAGIFQTHVTVQNLLQDPLGTSDGSTVDGVRIFFYDGLHVLAGEGNAEVLNPDSTAFFTAPEQPYFEYEQILQPYEISASKPWQFQIDSTVDRFSFTVYVSAPQPDESQPLLDAVWRGTVSSDWADGANWAGNAAPDSASAVSVPTDSLVAGTFFPVLATNAQATHLRVGSGSTVDLAGHTLTLWGNLDVVGAVSSGAVSMQGGSALLRGTIPDLRVGGTLTLQGTTQVTGTLVVERGGLLIASSANPITIINPTTP